MVNVGVKRQGFQVGWTVLLLLGLAAGPALSGPTIDGLVEASEYDFDFSFNLLTDSGGSGTGTFFVHDDGTTISIGLIASLTMNDTTYGTAIHPSWPSSRDISKLVGSDEWKIDTTSFDVTLDYLDGSTPTSGGTHNGSAGDNVMFESSMGYNFATATGAGPNAPYTTNSPLLDAGSLPGYSFTNEPNWVPEIMYEFSTTNRFGFGSQINAAQAETLANTILAGTAIHMSPIKLGKGKSVVCTSKGKGKGGMSLGCTVGPGPGPGTAPEPGTIALFGIGIAALAMRRRRARK